MFPIIPVVATAGVAGLAYLLLGDKAKATGGKHPDQLPKGPQGKVDPTKPQGLDIPPRQRGTGLDIPPRRDAPPVGPMMGTVIAPNGVKIRASTSEASTELGSKPFGSQVSILEPKPYPATPAAPKGWYKVGSTSGAIGYVSAQWISLSNDTGPAPSPGPSPTPQPSGVNARVIASGGLNVRDQPNTSGKLLVGLVQGTRLTVLDSNPLPATPGAPSGWYSVQTSAGVKGYASAEYIQLDNGALPTPPAPDKDSTDRRDEKLLPTAAINPDQPNMYAVTSKGGLNVRLQPKANAAVLAGLPFNSHVTRVDNVLYPPTAGAPKGWLKVATTSGTRGFASAEFLMPIDGTATMRGELDEDVWGRYDFGAEAFSFSDRYKMRA